MFLPPTGDAFGGGITPDGANPPGEDYSFAGYYYTGETGEVALGVWIREDFFGQDSNEQNPLDAETQENLDESLEAFGTTLLGLDRLINEDDVPEKSRREATGYVTIAEAYARGDRLPPGLEWGIYPKGGLYYLAIFDSP